MENGGYHNIGFSMWPFNGSVESRNLPPSVCSLYSFLPLHFIVSPILFPLFCSFCLLFWPSSLLVVYHFHFLLFCVSVRPVLEYSSTAWSTTAKTNQQSLDNIQNQALRIIAGAMESTPITFMEQTTAIQPLQQRRQAKVLLQTEKCLPDHPMKEKVEGRTKNRIKRSSFTHEVKKQTISQC